MVRDQKLPAMAIKPEIQKFTLHFGTPCIPSITKGQAVIVTRSYSWDKIAKTLRKKKKP
jgi:hypothetical protein